VKQCYHPRPFEEADAAALREKVAEVTRRREAPIEK